MTTTDQTLPSYIMEAYTTVVSYGADGCTMEQLAANLSNTGTATSYHTARRYIFRLLDEKMVEATGLKNGKATLYRAIRNDRMPRVPNSNPNKPPSPLGLVAEQLCTNPDEVIPHINHARRLGFYIATLGTFAQRWLRDGNDPDQVEMLALRKEMLEASRYALWQHRVLETMLANDMLWNPRRASRLWFEDPTNPVAEGDTYKWRDAARERLTTTPLVDTN